MAGWNIKMIYKGEQLRRLRKLIYAYMYDNAVRSDEIEFMEAMNRKSFGKQMILTHKQDYKLLTILSRCTGTWVS